MKKRKYGIDFTFNTTSMGEMSAVTHWTVENYSIINTMFLLVQSSNTSLILTCDIPCHLHAWLTYSFHLAFKVEDLNSIFFFFFRLVKAFSSWAIIKSSGLHTTEVSSHKRKTGIQKIGWSWCSFFLECSLCKNEIHYLWIDCCNIHQALVLQSLTTLSDIC